MSDRTTGVALVALVLAAVLGLVLFVGAAGARSVGTGAVEPRVFFGDRPPAPARTIAQIQERVPPPVRPLVPVQRQIAVTFGEAAGYLLVLLGVGAALVFARGPVVAAYRTTLGGWRAQARALALGVAMLAVIGSALFLMFMALLGVVAGPHGRFDAAAGAVRGSGGFALGPASLLQVGITAIAVAVVLIGIVAVIGLAAASWRLGDTLASLGPFSRVGQATPATLIALLGASLVYLVTQIPVIGPLALVAALAYALGTVAAARLASAPAG